MHYVGRNKFDSSHSKPVGRDVLWDGQSHVQILLETLKVEGSSGRKES